MDKVAPNSNFVGKSSEINLQSKIKVPFIIKVTGKLKYWTFFLFIGIFISQDGHVSKKQINVLHKFANGHNNVKKSFSKMKKFTQTMVQKQVFMLSESKISKYGRTCTGHTKCTRRTLNKIENTLSRTIAGWKSMCQGCTYLKYISHETVYERP